MDLLRCILFSPSFEKFRVTAGDAVRRPMGGKIPRRRFISDTIRPRVLRRYDILLEILSLGFMPLFFITWTSLTKKHNGIN